jgi:dTDP-glucose pyrophosphorylase
MVRRAVILAAGSASRMQENLENYISNDRELAAVRRGEKMAASFSRFPFLDYQILNLLHAGLEKINLVIQRDDSYLTEHYDRFAHSIFPEVEISYSFQELPDGTAHAVLAAEGFVGKKRFLVLNGDNNYSTSTIRMLAGSPEEYSAMVAFDVKGFQRKTRKKLKSFAVVKAKNGRLAQIVEKAQHPRRYKTSGTLHAEQNGQIAVKKRLLVSMNLWCLNAGILDACRMVERHAPRKEGKAGEFELPDAVKLYLETGNVILVYLAREDVLDLTRAEDIRIVESGIQEKLKERIAELEKRYALHQARRSSSS